VLVKELQSLALDIRTLDKNGNDIQLSTLCNDEEDNFPYSGRADLALIDEIVDNSVETDDMDDSFLINDADDDDFSYEEEEAYEGFDGFDDEDNI
jgi:DNA-directed RNA polymerase subunit beta